MNQFDIKELFIKNIKDNTTLNIALILVEEWSNYKSVLDKIKEIVNSYIPNEAKLCEALDEIDKLLEEIE